MEKEDSKGKNEVACEGMLKEETMHACYMKLDNAVAVLTPHFRMRVRERLQSDEREIAKTILKRMNKQLCLGKVYSVRVRDKAVKIRKVWNNKRKRIEIEFITITPLKFSFRGDIKISFERR